jgi:hypothetical protein
LTGEVWICKSDDFLRRSCKKDNFKSNDGMNPPVTTMTEEEPDRS